MTPIVSHVESVFDSDTQTLRAWRAAHAAVEHPTGRLARLLGDAVGHARGLLALTHPETPSSEPVMAAIRWPREAPPEFGVSEKVRGRRATS